MNKKVKNLQFFVCFLAKTTFFKWNLSKMCRNLQWFCICLSFSCHNDLVT